MLDSASKRSSTCSRAATRSRSSHPASACARRSFARRFIAGETVEEAIGAARRVEADGLRHTLDHLGESVGSLAEAETATRDYLDVINAVSRSGIERNLSLKLTQLGLDVDAPITVDNLRRILERAEPAGFFVRIDMESSAYTDVTLGSSKRSGSRTTAASASCSSPTCAAPTRTSSA